MSKPIPHGASREPGDRHHISSAVVAVRPEHIQSVVNSIVAMPDTEVPAFEGGKIIVVMEGPSSGVIADRLTQIALLDGVITANMVFEHVETSTDTPSPNAGA